MIKTDVFLKFLFLFCSGSITGWLIELIFRRFFSKNNREKIWVNPGFLSGPWLPLYGFGLCLLYTLCEIERNFVSRGRLSKAVLFIIMAISMTAIEYLSGIFSLKVLGVRLWDYSEEKGNYRGLVCPKFSFFWAVAGIVYYFFIHRFVLFALEGLLPLPVFTVLILVCSALYFADVIVSLKAQKQSFKF